MSPPRAASRESVVRDAPVGAEVPIDASPDVSIDVEVDADEAAFAEAQVRRGPTPVVVIVAFAFDRRTEDRLRALADLRNGHPRQWSREVVLRELPELPPFPVRPRLARPLARGREAIPGAFRCCFLPGAAT